MIAKIDNLQHCPSSLSVGFSTYSPTARKKLFDGKAVHHILPLESPDTSDETLEKFLENRQRISISGVQEKLSLILEGNNLRLTEKDEFGHYILKPIPRDLRNVEYVPANEHLTMQIAAQVFRIKTAENAMIFFPKGVPAYLVRRFDIDRAGNKRAMEDFASISQKSESTDGRHFKYDGSYEEIGRLISKYVAAYIPELDKFYRIVLFNYLFSNGDAHLKNFSLLETPNGDYVLSPAYDLICTKIHVDDSYFALENGLFSGEHTTESYNANGFPAYDDFYEFGQKLEIPEKRIKRNLQEFISSEGKVKSLIERSFLNTVLQKEYYKHYTNRLQALKYSFRGTI